MRYAPSAARSLVDAAPRPPAPPTSRICLPRSDSGNRRLLLLRGDVSASGYDQEHGEDFAVAKIMLEKTGDHRGENDRDRAVQDEAAVVAARRQTAQCPPEIGEYRQQQPKQDQ